MGLLTWGRRLDDRVLPRPAPGRRPPNVLGQFALMATIIFGGGGLFRLVFREETHTPGWLLWLYFAVALAGLAVLLVKVVHRRR